MDGKETISLKEFLEEKLNSLEHQTNMRFDSLDKALNLAREDARVKYEHLNALRSEVTTDRGLLVKIDMCKQQHNDLGRWKEIIDKKLTILETRSITWTAAVGIFFVMITLVMRWFGK
jgi:hypothetical protein